MLQKPKHKYTVYMVYIRKLPVPVIYLCFGRRVAYCSIVMSK